jgi:transposase-like protein
MPWNQVSIVEQRLRFLIEASQRTETMIDLCRRYGVSRKTGYKWLKRYQQSGTLAGLKDQPRRPQRSPRRTGAEQAQRVLAVRDQKGWGADKIA